MTKKIVLAAVRFEAEPLLQVLNTKRLDFEFHEIGIGAIKAARSAARLQQVCEGKEVIYVGTGGSFGKFSEPLLVKAGRVLWLPPCLREGISWAIEGIDKPYDLPKSPVWAQELPERTIICSPTISKTVEMTSNIVAEYELGRPEKLVENLELYSCAEAICSVAKSFVAILGITNAVGPEGRTQWRNNFKAVADMTAAYISDVIC